MLTGGRRVPLPSLSHETGAHGTGRSANPSPPQHLHPEPGPPPQSDGRPAAPSGADGERAAHGAHSAARPQRVEHHVEHIMGIPISIAVRTGGPGDLPAAATLAAVSEAFASLRRADELFSPFKPDSQVSQLRDRRMTLAGCDPDVRAVLRICDDLRRATGGSFDACAAGPDQLDPCGVVKGWAAERASDLLAAAGVTAHSVNAGGDVHLRGRPAADRRWRVGIADPHRPGNLLTAVHGENLAVATSGTAERGLHVIDPRRGMPAAELASVTVVGPSLTTADGYATAAVAMGFEALPWLADLDAYEAFVVDAGQGVWWTAGFPHHAPDLERKAASR